MNKQPSKPVVSKPAASKPAASKPAASQPAAIPDTHDVFLTFIGKAEGVTTSAGVLSFNHNEFGDDLRNQVKRINSLIGNPTRIILSDSTHNERARADVICTPNLISDQAKIRESDLKDTTKHGWRFTFTEKTAEYPAGHTFTQKRGESFQTRPIYKLDKDGKPVIDSDGKPIRLDTEKLAYSVRDDLLTATVTLVKAYYPSVSAGDSTNKSKTKVLSAQVAAMRALLKASGMTDEQIDAALASAKVTAV